MGMKEVFFYNLEFCGSSFGLRDFLFILLSVKSDWQVKIGKY